MKNKNKNDYEDYDEVSVNYDSSRIATGFDSLIKCISASKSPLNKINLLSVGCGTGNYEIKLANYLGKVFGIDISPKMIKKAKEKSIGIKNIAFYTGDAKYIDKYFKQRFDVVLFNQSIHHIGDFNSQYLALQKAYNILKSNGLVIIQTCSQDQLRDGFWYHNLSQKALKILLARFISISNLIKILNEIGFRHSIKVISLDANILGDNYLDFNGIFRKSWRSGSSFWSLLTENELKDVQRKVSNMINDGTIQNYLVKRENLRKKVGQFTYVYAFKND